MSNFRIPAEAMNRILSLFSFGAFGLLIAGVLMVVMSGPSARLPPSAESFAPTPEVASAPIDVRSLIIGIIAGWTLAYAGRIPWFELPARAIGWLLKNERNLLRFGMAAILLGVVIFY